jgi:acetate kinase
LRILVLNFGSASVKFHLIDTDEKAIVEASDRRLASGMIERIGGEAISR